MAVSIYHNGVKLITKYISLLQPQAIAKYRKKLENQDRIIVEEKCVSGFLFITAIAQQDRDRYYAKPRIKPNIREIEEG